MHWMFRLILAGLALPLATAALAAPPSLMLPIACTPGTDCWITNYLDHDESDGVRDYMCGTASYNTGAKNAHNGTDFALRDVATMREGVPVLAAAAGTVIGVRDGMEDVSVRDLGSQAVAGRECGNGVRVEHGGGWTTQYCHLRRGSIQVRKGDRVAAGQRLALVGLSGLSEYPHLHFQVEMNGEAIDPFVGERRTEGCGAGRTPLWAAPVLAQLAYGPGAIYNVGFAAGEPDIGTARDGGYRDLVLPRDASAMVLWADIFNVRAGDRVEFRIVGPDGREVFRHSASVDRNQARRFVFAGRKRPSEDWPAGEYRGEVTFLTAAKPDLTRQTKTAMLIVN